MKKLGPINPDIENWDLLLLACGKIDDLIDLVNSQQEAIKKLKEDIRPYTEEELSKMSFWPNREKGEIAMGEKILEPADDKPEYKLPGTEEIIEKLDKATLRPNLVDGIADDTHRTVTLRIPRGMTFVEALFYADLSLNMSDNQAQKALNEVQPNE